MDSADILVVDDDEEMLALLQDSLTREGWRVQKARSGQEALHLIEETDFHVVLSDLRMQEMNGIQLLREIRTLRPTTMVVIITAFGSIETAIEAIKSGAYHFVTKPVKLNEVSLVVRKAIEEQALRKENIRLRQEVENRYQFANIIGRSKKMQELFSLILRVASTSSNILILGESGTGKELVAKAIHYNSPRKDKPFIPVNCSAIPEGLLESELFGHAKGAFTGAHVAKRGLFEEAHRGTLFLDEIGDMGLGLQSKLLRSLEDKKIRPVGKTEEKEIDVRIMAATNSDLQASIHSGKFRTDLYYRLNVISIQIPPLRERPEDIPLLAEHFLRKIGVEMNRSIRGFTPAAMQVLMHYPWPGNVRELENAIERATAMMAEGEWINPQDLPEDLIRQRAASAVMELGSDRVLPLRDMERRYILSILKKNEGNKLKTAKELEIGSNTLWRKLKQYDAN